MEARREIQVLPDEVIDQIAAGEVVERPSSVVKELVENALDAGATHITIEVEKGGKQLIRVLDNGIGMTEAELRVALQRHATSKLRALEDVFSLQTMGFRGEALPSIASVSRATIITRTRDQVAGTRMDIEGGEIVRCAEVGAPVGTQLEVRDLLFNVPARLKFLKGDATEASHVTDVVSRLALANPQVHVRLRHGGRIALDAPLHPNGLERARAILGSRLGRRLHLVSGRENGIQVEVYLAAPELAQSTSRGAHLFVGRRSVRDRGLLQALNMGYGELVPKGRYPVAVLHLDVPGGDVDVNVHPQKLEVRFSDPQAVYAAVRHVVRRGVAEAPWLADSAEPGRSVVAMRTGGAAGRTGAWPEGAASRLAADHAAETTRSVLSFGRAEARGGAHGETHGENTTEDARAASPAARPFPAVTASTVSPSPGRPSAFPASPPASPASTPAASPAARAGTAPGRSIGQTSFPMAPPAPPASGDWGPSERPAGPRRSTPSWHSLASRAGEAGAPARLQASDQAGAPASPQANAESGVQAGAESGAQTGAEAEARARPRVPSQAEARASDQARAGSASQFFSRLHYIGQLDRTYLVCELEGEMVLVDQHAAHERVAFQRLRDRYQQHAVPVQRLLFPKTLELAPGPGAVVDECREILTSMGFEIEPFGGTTFALKAVPAGLREAETETVLLELLDELVDRGGSRALEERLDLALATIACHSVVRAGDLLSDQEVWALFESLDQVDFKAHCPHGRPVLLRISVSEIARRFGRT